MREFSHKI